MARLFGLIGNRADLSGQVIDLERDVLRVPAGMLAPGAVSWGIGFYQGSEVLLRRRPHDERGSIDLGGLARDLRADLILGHVRAATVGGARTENTHPFRYREWLFAHTGSISRYAEIKPRLLESIPEFLRKNIRGDTDSEVLFHVVLSFLHDAGRLQEGGADGKTMAAALRSAASLIDHLVSEEGGEPGFHVNALLTDGERLAALHRDGAPSDDGTVTPTRMAYRYVHGRAALDALVADDALRKVRLTDPGAVRFSLIASDFASDQHVAAPSAQPYGGSLGVERHAGNAWTAVPPRAIVVLTRDGEPSVETL
jgi:predicted glutamine amidotransferase